LDASKSATLCVKKDWHPGNGNGSMAAAATVSAAINPVKMAARRALMDQGTS